MPRPLVALAVVFAAVIGLAATLLYWSERGERQLAGLPDATVRGEQAVAPDPGADTVPAAVPRPVAEQQSSVSVGAGERSDAGETAAPTGEESSDAAGQGVGEPSAPASGVEPETKTAEAASREGEAPSGTEPETETAEAAPEEGEEPAAPASATEPETETAEAALEEGEEPAAPASATEPETEIAEAALEEGEGPFSPASATGPGTGIAQAQSEGQEQPPSEPAATDAATGPGTGIAGAQPEGQEQRPSEPAATDADEPTPPTEAASAPDASPTDPPPSDAAEAVADAGSEVAGDAASNAPAVGTETAAPTDDVIEPATAVGAASELAGESDATLDGPRETTEAEPPDTNTGAATPQLAPSDASSGGGPEVAAPSGEAEAEVGAEVAAAESETASDESSDQTSAEAASPPEQASAEIRIAGAEASVGELTPPEARLRERQGGASNLEGAGPARSEAAQKPATPDGADSAPLGASGLGRTQELADAEKSSGPTEGVVGHPDAAGGEQPTPNATGREEPAGSEQASATDRSDIAAAAEDAGRQASSEPADTDIAGSAAQEPAGAAEGPEADQSSTALLRRGAAAGDAEARGPVAAAGVAEAGEAGGAPARPEAETHPAPSEADSAGPVDADLAAAAGGGEPAAAAGLPDIEYRPEPPRFARASPKPEEPDERLASRAAREEADAPAGPVDESAAAADATIPGAGGGLRGDLQYPPPTPAIDPATPGPGESGTEMAARGEADLEERPPAAASPSAAPAASAAPASSAAPAGSAEPQQKIKIRAAEIEASILYVAGEAPPGTLIRIYADDDFVGEAEATDQGTWLVEAEKEIPAGEIVIRADAIAPGGEKPVARAELSFVRRDDGVVLEPVVLAEAAGAATTGFVPEPLYIIIRRGDNLWRISRRNYGRGVRYEAIFAANRDQIRNPHLIYPGQVFVMPTRDRSWEAAVN